MKNMINRRGVGVVPLVEIEETAYLQCVRICGLAIKVCGVPAVDREQGGEEVHKQEHAAFKHVEVVVVGVTKKVSRLRGRERSVSCLVQEVSLIHDSIQATNECVRRSIRGLCCVPEGW